VTLPHSCVIQVFIGVAWQQTRRGDAQLFTARLGTEKTPLRLLLRNRGSVFRCYCSCTAYIRHNKFPTMQVFPGCRSSPARCCCHVGKDGVCVILQFSHCSLVLLQPGATHSAFVTFHLFCIYGAIEFSLAS
jgi:hypothetical protein